MCNSYKRTYVCGHQQGSKWFQPADPKDCPDVRRANRRHATTGALLRCTPKHTTHTVMVAGTCGKNECWVKHNLLPVGWKCCRCRFKNGRDVARCAGGNCGTRHAACRGCTQKSS